MPELPEVEMFTRYFRDRCLGLKIVGVDVHAPGILEGVSPAELADLLVGKKFVSAQRHGKNLLAGIAGGGVLTVHFGMSGFISFFGDISSDTPYDRMLISFEKGFLSYDNRRMIGRIGYAPSIEEFIRDRRLAPDILDFAEGDFIKAFAGRKGPLKSLLMDQSLMAGIGNEYADEILFQARLHPKTPVHSLSPEKTGQLFGLVRKVLETAVAAEADHDRFPDSYFLRTRRRSDRCPRCGAGIETIKVGGRSTYFCPACQPEGQPQDDAPLLGML